MGDLNEDFSNEELETLGEEPNEVEPDKSTAEPEGEGEPKEEVETEGSEQPEESEKEEEEPQPFPDDGSTDLTKEQIRINRLWKDGKIKESEATQTTQKLELLKTDPNSYYEKYPEEKQEAPQEAPQEAQQNFNTLSQAGDLVVQSGPYKDMTLKEVHEVDSWSAQEMFDKYRENERLAGIESDKARTESDTQISAMQESLAKDTYGIELSEIDKKQTDEINTIIEETISWMETTGRAPGNLADAYYLKNRGKIDNKTKGEAVKSFVKSVKENKQESIDSKNDNGATIDVDVVDMSKAQLDAHISGLSGNDFMKFMKDAPEDIKKAHPGFAWD